MKTFENGKKIENLLSEAHHDIVNVLNSINLANGLIELYCKKLIPIFNQLDDKAKSDLRLDDTDIELLVKNFLVIKQDTYFGSYYMKSLRYNFVQHADFLPTAINISTLMDEANNQYSKIFSDHDTSNFRCIGAQEAVVKANRDMILNIVVRFLRLGKYYVLKEVNLNQDNQYHILTFRYDTSQMLLTHIADLDDPLLHLSEMKVAFNLSLAYNYLPYCGGKIDYVYHDDHTDFMIYLLKEQGESAK